VFGYELLSSRLIRARRFAGLPIAQQVQEWQRLPPSLQTPRTTARDLRRMFRVFGLLEEFPTGNYGLTERGERIVRSSESFLSNDEIEAWTNALINLKFYSAADDPAINAVFRIRPFVLMLDLLEHQSLDKKLLTFSMAASSERPAEIQRIRTIVSEVVSGSKTLDQALQTEGIPRAQAANLVKILPSMGEQLALIERHAGVSSITQRGRLFLANARDQIPIWYRDLPGNATQKKRMAGVLATLAQGAVEEHALSQVLTGIGYSVSQSVVDLNNVGIHVTVVGGFVSATPPISFDLLQDVPAHVRHDPIFGVLGNLLGAGVVLTPATLVTPTGSLSYLPRPRPSIRRRRIRGANQITNPAMLMPRRGASATAPLAIDPLDQARRMELVRERTEQHQRLVASMAELYLARGIIPVEGDFDLLVEVNGVAVLHEMKTLTDTNERLQVMHAVGQLFYYEYFSVPHEVGTSSRIEKAVVFDRVLADQSHIDYLESLGIYIYWRTPEEEINGTPISMVFLRSLLGI